MDITKFILLYYKEQRYIFGVCPGCQQIFRLADCTLSFQGKSIGLKQLDDLMEKREAVDEQEEMLQDKQGDVDNTREEIEDIELEYDSEIQPIIEKKYKVTGRRQALAKIKKVDKFFVNKNIDQRDVRLLFDPVEYLVFKGLTDGGLSKLSFVGKAPQNKRQEKILESMSKTIKNGNYEFTLIRISDDGCIDYSC